MLDVRIDHDGHLRCWNCGSTQFSERRTGLFWFVTIVGGLLTIGIFALVALVFVKPKLQCQVCNEWNRPGHAQPYTGPARNQLAAPDLAAPTTTAAPRPKGDHLPSRRQRDA